jgi:SAM-dependent methyltransferase
MTECFDQQTMSFYQDKAPVYTASGPKGASRHMPSFLERLPAGASVLELGCGGGRDAEFMIARGFEVEATDGVPAIAAKASERLGFAVRVMRFDELDARGKYDAVVASASLLHVPREGLPDILARVWNALKPGGWHLATYKTGQIDDRDEFGRYFNYLDRQYAEAIYAATGDWDLTEFAEYSGSGYLNVPAMWLKVVAQKAAS